MAARMFLIVCFTALVFSVAPASAQVPVCDDGIDNDADGVVDLDDPGCRADRQGADETDPAPVPSTVSITTLRPYACGIQTGVRVRPDLTPRRLFPFADVAVTVRGAGLRKTRHMLPGHGTAYRFDRLRPGRYRVTVRYTGDRFRLASTAVTRTIRLSRGRCRTYFVGSDFTRRYRPHVLALGASQTIDAVTWQRWGRSAARGSGSFPANNCIPYCAAGTITRYPVTVRLSRPRVCGGYLQFLTLRWTYRGSRPGGAPRTDRTTFDFTC